MRVQAKLRSVGIASVLSVFALLATGQDQPPQAPAAATFSKKQLEQLVAPMALYPDGLVSQVLMAATYPLEIVEAARFMKANPVLKGNALEGRLKEQDWDASVKSLCGFPDAWARKP